MSFAGGKGEGKTWRVRVFDQGVWSWHGNVWYVNIVFLFWGGGNLNFECGVKFVVVYC